MNVIIGDNHAELIRDITAKAKRGTKTALNRSSIVRAMLDVLAKVEPRLDYVQIRSEEALTRAVLGLLRPK